MVTLIEVNETVSYSPEYKVGAHSAQNKIVSYSPENKAVFYIVVKSGNIV